MLCDAFGWVEGIYKPLEVFNPQDNCTHASAQPVATSYRKAVEYCHEWIEDNADLVKGMKGGFEIIEIFDEMVEKYGELVIKEVPAYKISAAKARKFILS